MENIFCLIFGQYYCHLRIQKRKGDNFDHSFLARQDSHIIESNREAIYIHGFPYCNSIQHAAVHSRRECQIRMPSFCDLGVKEAYCVIFILIKVNGTCVVMH